MILQPQFVMPAQAASSGLISNGLTVRYLFDDGSGTTATDLSGNGRDGTIYGGPTWGSDADGEYLDTDNVDDYVLLPEATYISATGYTVFAYLTSPSYVPAAGAQILSSDRYPTSSKREWQFRFDLGGKIRVIRFISGSNTQIVSSSSYLSSTIRVGFTFGSAFGTKIYVNGSLDGSSTDTAANVNLSGPPTINCSLNLGSSSPGYFLGAKYYEARIYNRAFSDSEMIALTTGNG